MTVISSVKIDIQAHLWSAIESSMKFPNFYNANLEKLEFIFEVWFQPRLAPEQQISCQSV